MSFRFDKFKALLFISGLWFLSLRALAVGEDKISCNSDYQFKWDESKQACFQKTYIDFCDDSQNGSIHPDIAQSIAVIKTLSREETCAKSYRWLYRQQSLNLSQKNISNIAILSNLAFLKTLDISHNPVKDLFPLGYLHQLKELNLFATEVESLSSLFFLAGLEVLKVPSKFKLSPTLSTDLLPSKLKIEFEEEKIPQPAVESVAKTAAKGDLPSNSLKKYGGSTTRYTKCVNAGDFALTFDDGPSKQYESLLKVLAEENVKVTFFVVGQRLGNASYVQYLKDAHEAGHLIASHSWTHPQLTKLSQDGVASEMKNTEKKVEDIIHEKMHYMRPPYGAINDRVAEQLKELGYEIVMWNIDTSDYMSQNSGEIIYQKIARVVTAANPKTDSFISLQHDLHPKSVNQTKRIIQTVKESGFKFVTVDECLNPKQTITSLP